MQYWGLTDPGCVRKQNQDTFLIQQLDRNTLLCVVCDGMGGAKSGNIASSLAAEVFAQEIGRCWHSNMDREKIDQMLRSAVKLANFTVYDQAQQFYWADMTADLHGANLVFHTLAVQVSVGSAGFGVELE